MVVPETGPEWRGAVDKVIDRAASLGLRVILLEGESASLEQVLAKLSVTKVCIFLGHGSPLGGGSSVWHLVDGELGPAQLSSRARLPSHMLSLACHGAATDHSSDWPARELDGLAEAFLSAGTISFTGSQWPMELQSAQVLADIWLRMLVEKGSVRGVCGLFAETMLGRQDELADPFVWSGLRHFGR